MCITASGDYKRSDFIWDEIHGTYTFIFIRKSFANLLLVEPGDGVERVEADEAAVLGLAELAAEVVRHPLVGQQLVEPEQVTQDLKEVKEFSIMWVYRVTMVVWDLGWVDSGLGCSLGFLAATVATYCPGRMVEQTKVNPTWVSDHHCHPVLRY